MRFFLKRVTVVSYEVHVSRTGLSGGEYGLESCCPPCFPSFFRIFRLGSGSSHVLRFITFGNKQRFRDEDMCYF